MSSDKKNNIPQTKPIKSSIFNDAVTAEIRRAAATGIYDIRGGGAKRHVPHFDDLLFLGASMSRYPLEGYRESCDTRVTLGTRFAKKPLQLDIPITIAGMSFGALSRCAAALNCPIYPLRYAKLFNSSAFLAFTTYWLGPTLLSCKSRRTG